MTYNQKASLVREEVFSLKNKPVRSTLAERWYLLDKATRLYEGQPQPTAQSKGIEYILENASVPIREHDILLGRFEEHVPTKEEDAVLKQIYSVCKSKENPINGLNRGHICFDVETLVNIGIMGYMEKAEQKLASAHDEREKLFYTGMLCIYRAVKTYIERYAKAAREAGLDDAAEVCKSIAERAPTTFREAMQLVYILFNVYNIYAGRRVACMTLGRMDEYMLPFYLGDIQSGRATLEQIEAVIDDFNCKCNLHLGRGEHQMATKEDAGNNSGWNRNPSYDSPTYVVIGGYSNKVEGDNPLTELFAKHIPIGLKEPVYIWRWTPDRNRAAWKIICEKLRDNASVLMYNDTTMIPAMKNIGVEEYDAVEYTLHACNWPDIAGGYATYTMCGEPIPKTICDALYKDGRLCTDISSIDDAYGRIADSYRVKIKEQFDAYREKVKRLEECPTGVLSVTDCFTAGPIDSGRSLFECGVKYKALYTRLRNIGTAADMMSALDTLVFKNKSVTLEELSAAIAGNFEDFDNIRALCMSAPKFGTDNEFADAHAKRLMNMLLDIIDEQSVNSDGIRDVISLNVTIADSDHIKDGEALPATLDSRLAGEPLSENLSPSNGYNTSVTSVLNSVSKLPFKRLHSGAHNIRLSRGAVAGDNGLVSLIALLDTYFERGGMQAQISIADTAILKKAQECPDDYCDLLVRITGYSAIFTDMSKRGQDEIIKRDENS